MQNIICPHCKNELTQSENKTVKCLNNHSFDVSKEGYLNLLRVNKKKSNNPGDNEMMVAARRNFLEKGYYNPLIDAIKETIENELTFSNKAINILDAGCGEGYYSQKSLSDLAKLSTNVIGTDISKSAVKYAAKKYKNNFYFVSSVYDLPVANNSMDVVLSVFSPVPPPQFKRVLKEDGYLIIVSPGENHMKDLAQLIYNDFRSHEYNIIENMDEIFKHVLTKRKTFEITITNSETLLNLLKMTPYYWNTSKEGQEKINDCKDITITCDFNLTVFNQNKLNS
jgi:23S rRNA (guanine745-N1)-methyltransferase